MQIIISPAKKMRVLTDFMEPSERPVFLRDAEKLKAVLTGYSRQQLKELYRANDSITELNYQRLREMDLTRDLTPAVLAYVGLQYQSMAPQVFTAGQWEYVKEHLKILSGFYGILGACDGVTPYRLEMQAKLPVAGKRDLYEFWGGRIALELIKDGRPVLNLASKEYSRAVEPYIDGKVRFTSCTFGALSGGKLRVKATAAKTARGAMARWLAEQGTEDPDGVRDFHEYGYRYSEVLSSRNEYVFLLENGEEPDF